MKKKQCVALAFSSGLFAIAFLMLFTNFMDLEIYLIGGFILLLIIIEMAGTALVKPTYILRLEYVLILTGLALGVVLALKVLEIVNL